MFATCPALVENGISPSFDEVLSSAPHGCRWRCYRPSFSRVREPPPRPVFHEPLLGGQLVSLDAEPRLGLASVGVGEDLRVPARPVGGLRRRLQGDPACEALCWAQMLLERIGPVSWSLLMCGAGRSATDPRCGSARDAHFRWGWRPVCSRSRLPTVVDSSIVRTKPGHAPSPADPTVQTRRSNA